MQTASLTAKQTRFVSEYLIDGNGSAAAVRAGYSPKAARAIATENLTKPAIQNALQARQSADATRLSLQRDNVLAGLVEAINQAREQRNPMAMIRGWSEVAKMLGFYQPEIRHVEVSAAGEGAMGQLEQMSDAELVALIAAGGAAARK
jgi:phage terminase small subunit